MPSSAPALVLSAKSRSPTASTLFSAGARTRALWASRRSTASGESATAPDRAAGGRRPAGGEETPRRARAPRCASHRWASAPCAGVQAYAATFISPAARLRDQRALQLADPLHRVVAPYVHAQQCRHLVAAAAAVCRRARGHRSAPRARPPRPSARPRLRATCACARSRSSASAAATSADSPRRSAPQPAIAAPHARVRRNFEYNRRSTGSESLSRFARGSSPAASALPTASPACWVPGCFDPAPATADLAPVASNKAGHVVDCSIPRPARLRILCGHCTRRRCHPGCAPPRTPRTGAVARPRPRAARGGGDREAEQLDEAAGVLGVVAGHVERASCGW